MLKIEFYLFISISCSYIHAHYTYSNNSNTRTYVDSKAMLSTFKVNMPSTLGAGFLSDMVKDKTKSGNGSRIGSII